MNLVGNVHIAQGGEAAIPAILELVRAQGIETEGNPDIDIRVYPQFSVDDARALCERAITRGVGGTRRVFIVVAGNLTYEAQNTMLKTLEEPAGDALFFLVVPSPEMLLSTVRSRSQMLTLPEDSRISKVDAHAFLGASASARLDMLKPLIDKDEDDVRDTAGIIAFLAALERALADFSRSRRFDTPSREGLEAIYRARKYVGDKGSLVKALLEQVALITPRA